VATFGSEYSWPALRAGATVNPITIRAAIITPRVTPIPEMTEARLSLQPSPPPTREDSASNPIIPTGVNGGIMKYEDAELIISPTNPAGMNAPVLPLLANRANSPAIINTVIGIIISIIPSTGFFQR
jgi:hypothetical protein